MVTLPDSIVLSVKRFLAAIEQRQSLDAAYLYGSQAKGNATEWSDIDIAIISSDFSANSFQERLFLMRLAAKIDERIEPHPFTPEDFSAVNPLACEIQKTGIRLA